MKENQECTSGNYCWVWLKDKEYNVIIWIIKHVNLVWLALCGCTFKMLGWELQLDASTESVWLDLSKVLEWIKCIELVWGRMCVLHIPTGLKDVNLSCFIINKTIAFLLQFKFYDANTFSKSIKETQRFLSDSAPSVVNTKE